jgi:cobalt/nickel transport protein
MNVISRRTNYLLLLGVILMVIIPLVFIQGEFGGTDDAGSAAVLGAVPGYKPWFEPIWKPPSPEIESLLFAVQAAFGAGIIGYVLGRIHGAHAREAEKETMPKEAMPNVAD